MSCSETCLIVSTSLGLICVFLNALNLFFSDLGSEILIFDDSVKVDVHSVGDEESEPLHGEVPVLELMALGYGVVLFKSREGVYHGVSVVKE